MISDIKRPDHRAIFSIVESGAKVLDLGCGDGELIFLLAHEKSARVQGIELDEKSIYACVAKGLSVFHSDIDTGLPEYPDKSFDYVVLNQTLQQAKRIEFVMKEALRVGRKVIVGIPNFAFIQSRVHLFFNGRAPVTKALPYRWYDTPNTHFLTIKDFREYCENEKIQVTDSFYLSKNGAIRYWPNLFAETAVFVLTK